MLSSVACILLKEDSCLPLPLVFIAKRIPGGEMGEHWEFPGGKVEEGEDYSQAAIREFREEFGADIHVGEEIASAQFIHKNKTRELHAFRCYLAPNAEENFSEESWTLSEHTETAWVELSRIKNLSFVDSDLLLYPALEEYLAR